MSAHPVSWYRDPAEAYAKQEAKTCKGCVWEHRLLIVPRCGKGNTHGKRCQSYKEKPDGCRRHG